LYFAVKVRCLAWLEIPVAYVVSSLPTDLPSASAGDGGELAISESGDTDSLVE
jgi:D-arabinose 5-phosphate isomerase GutQ